MHHIGKREILKSNSNTNKIQSIIKESESRLQNRTGTDQTQITVLVENNRYLLEEELEDSHGLSLYVDRGGLTFLLDLGDRDIYYKNSKKLGININEVDFAFISHGHYDHGGGLTHFLNSNTKARVYLKANAIQERHFSIKNRIYRDISISNQVLAEHPGRFVFVKNMTKIAKGLYIITDITKNYTLPHGNKSLFKESKEKMVPDDFNHEQILIIKDSSGLIVFSGCNHNGILNTIETVQHYFKKDPIKAVIGGFHLTNPTLGKMTETPDEVKAIGLKLSKYRVEKYITGHCTGIKAYVILKTILNDRLYHLGTGMHFTL